MAILFIEWSKKKEKKTPKVRGENKGKKQGEDIINIEFKKYKTIFHKVYMAVIGVMIITRYIYYVGNVTAKSKMNYDIITLESSLYAIAYTSSEDAVLLACDVSENEITIHKNIQMVMNINEKVIEKKVYSKVEVMGK